ncbi:MAG: hypothetical protein JSS34_06405 [Proteobacteria bacterium]|nr:hypothetical protein [Pseudomonadota bacterium]
MFFKKIKFWLSLYFIIISFFQYASLKAMQIIDIPAEGETCSLHQALTLQNNNNVIDNCLASLMCTEKQKFLAAIPEEAEHYFFKDLADRVGEEKALRIFPVIFSHTYFGDVERLRGKESKKLHPDNSHLTSSLYWIGHIINMLNTGIPGSHIRDWSMEEAIKNGA